jgi:tol-pal system protein YbgF
MVRRGIVLLGCALIALTGCASSGSVRKLDDESRVSQERLAEIIQANEALRTELAALRTQLEALRKELDGAVRERDRVQREAMDELAKRAAASEKKVETLTGAVRAVELTVGGVADQVARLETASTGGGRRDGRGSRAAVRTSSLAADELYNRAMESFKGGELAQAILDFEDFVARYPTHPQVGTAQFWIGEAYYNARDYQHATAEYKKAVELAPKGEKAPEALFKLGLAHRALRRPDRAREAWAQLIRDFPQTEVAQKARVAQREVSRAPRATSGGEPR